MFWPCETRTSTCRSFATISSGLYRFLAIAVLLDVKDIPQVGPLQWGWIRPRSWRHSRERAFPMQSTHFPGGSPTYGKYVSTELSSESGHQVYIPIGFAAWIPNFGGRRRCDV